ncbi:MAG: class I SAM-dependent methyltransferase [Enhygromyxa sp.]
MPWLMASVYDRVMAGSEDVCLRGWRSELFADLQGRVLEVGAGTGASIPCYPAAVSELVLAEPDPHMRRRLQARIDERCRVVAAPIEALGVDDESFDAIVSSLVLCSVESPAIALRELHRVLRPGGQLLFIEHVAAWDNPGRLRWQHRVEPVWKRFAGNCHLTRDTERSIREAGFEIEQLERDTVRKVVPLVRPSIRGRARKPA